jgi:gliding motility-associated-like protein
MSFGFTLSITHTNETCPGNGSLNFTVSGADPNGTIVYVVYKLPDVTTPYASGTSTVLNGLVAGNYRVIARETVGSTTTTQEQDVTITSSFIPLTYTVDSVNQACSNNSTVSVNVATGTAVTYAIISGPSTFPPQASNTFSGLAAGVYRIRVTDSCGNSVVQAFSVTVNPTLLTTINPNFTDVQPPSCDFLVANNMILAAPGTVIAYPLQVHYILHLPTGDSHINVVLNSGDPAEQAIAQTIPYFASQNYIYDVILTDACGITYPLNNFIVNNDIQLSHSLQTLPCNQYYFILNADNYVGTYTLNFTSAPAGFNPAAFDSAYPGPYIHPSAVFGGPNNVVPFGDYEVTITDPCGKTETIQFTIEDIPPVPNLVEVGDSCLSTTGQLIASIANTKIVTAIVIAAPPNYPFPLPHNVTALIDSAGALTLAPIPLGDYTLLLTDDCGNVYPPLSVGPPPVENLGLKIDVLQGCDLGIASVRVKSNNSKLTTIKITAAPTAYSFPIPHDVSNHIVNTGELYLDDLPSGNYTFSTEDECNFISNESVAIDGYAITTGDYSLVADCGVFNVPLDFVDNVTSIETFGLQILLDAATNTWGNPVTEEVYVDGTPPDSNNSYILQNHTTNANLTFNGVFRIVHHFTSFNNGSDINNGIVPSATKNCIEILGPLSFTDALAINDVLRIPCSSTGNFDVLLLTTGPAPLHYRIIEKDSFPFIVDNGNSNIFTNLAPGIYKFEVEDLCGNTVTRTFDVSDLDSLVTIYPSCTLFNCVGNISGNETFDLSSQTAIILGHQSPADYTLTYHVSQADADSNSNPITNLTAYNPVGNPATVYFRLIFNQLPNCYQTGSFDIITGQTPRINLLPEYVACDGLPVLLDASVGNLPTTVYAWSNGSIDPAITISDIGTTTVSVTATNDYGICNGTSFSCSTSQDITVKIADIPVIDHIDTHDWTDNENSITIVTTHQGDYEYSIDGINFQDSPNFLHLTPGLYTLHVRDSGGCRTITEEIWLLNYPKFFTPNGDGYNETWYVRNSEHEPNFKVFIYDRYGKLITGFPSGTPGWDGKLNGRLLFADDYWFTAYRQDGRVHRGHFTLKR